MFSQNLNFAQGSSDDLNPEECTLIEKSINCFNRQKNSVAPILIAQSNTDYERIDSLNKRKTKQDDSTTERPSQRTRTTIEIIENTDQRSRDEKVKKKRIIQKDKLERDKIRRDNRVEQERLLRNKKVEWERIQRDEKVERGARYQNRKLEQQFNQGKAQTIQRIIIPKISSPSQIEMKKLNEAAIKSGYSGYSYENMIGLISKVNRGVGFVQYVNKVVGCYRSNQSFCRKWYPYMEVKQVLENIVIYTFSEKVFGKQTTFSLAMARETGKKYPKIGSLENTYYVFKGIRSYTTPKGGVKRVPFFRKARIRK